MSNFRSAYDIQLGILKRCGELQNGSSPFHSNALEYANGIYQSIISGSSEFDFDLGEPWIWAKSKYPGVIILKAPYETGTVALTNGSASGTFSVAPSISLAGRYLKLTNVGDIFRISAHAAASTSFTLDSVYTDQDTSGVTFKAIQLDCDLQAGVQRLIGPMVLHRNQGVMEDLDHMAYELGESKLKQKFPMSIVEEGVPTHFAQISDVDGLITVRMNKFVDSDTRMEYDFIPVPTDLIVQSFLDAAVTVGTDLITIANHGFTDGNTVSFATSGTLPTGLSANTLYYIVNSTATSFKVSLTLGGTAVDITAASGGGTHQVSSVPVLPREARVLIEYGASHWIMLDKNDDRAGSLLQLTQLKCRALIEANRKEKQQASKDRGRLIPRLDMGGPDRRWFAGGTD